MRWVIYTFTRGYQSIFAAKPFFLSFFGGGLGTIVADTGCSNDKRNVLVAGVGDPGSAWISNRERGFAVHLLMRTGVTDPGYKGAPGSPTPATKGAPGSPTPATKGAPGSPTPATSLSQWQPGCV